MYAANDAVLCFYPLAGFRADNRICRFITVYEATKFLLLLIILEGIVFVADIIMVVFVDISINLFFDIIVAIITFILLLTAVTLALFNANIIQFSVDQLQDSPADYQSLYIYWYVCVNYVVVFILLTGSTITRVSEVAENLYISITFVVAGPTSIVLLYIILIVVHCKKHWFLIDSARSNPYKLVYRVTKFARQHKVPIRRSAFTYCEDDIPNGLDLGKNKYGGPFITEQVEDVKAFYGVLKILFSIGVTFFIDIASGPLFTLFFLLQNNSIIYDTTLTAGFLIEYILLKKGILSSTLVVLGEPIYICFIHPYYH